ncbi:kinase-like domain-containing protein [Rhizophagus diaphanus]|nr:kinase-like domain-containing protein [Rhizophagus diaphanus] [Rhizophagus sp. MUCL 43196]
MISLLSLFGKSGNTIIDEFISEKRLKWIPYNKFKNVEYLDKGGFGVIYKAIWLGNNDVNSDVVLKCHENLNDNLNEFLNEWRFHESFLDSNDIIKFYGFTRNPDTLNYMVVLDYANKGNLRGNLTKIIKNDWKQKLHMLYDIISGLDKIHKQNLIHCDFHDGNILNHNVINEDKIYISDLGLCRPAKSFLEKDDIYGVVPFMAPEILRGRSYTPASDIYSFSMIMWEFTSGVPPFSNREHDIQLSLSICKGERPEIIQNTPQCYVDLMKKCWNEDPLKRPTSEEVLNIIEEWIYLPFEKEIKDINEELKHNVMEFINAPILHNDLDTKSHPQAYYISRLLDFNSKKLNESLETEDSQTSVNVNELLVSDNLNDYIIKDLKPEDSQASVNVNEVLVSDNLNDYIVKDLKSLDEN